MLASNLQPPRGSLTAPQADCDTHGHTTSPDTLAGCKQCRLTQAISSSLSRRWTAVPQSPCVPTRDECNCRLQALQAQAVQTHEQGLQHLCQRTPLSTTKSLGDVTSSELCILNIKLQLCAPARNSEQSKRQGHGAHPAAPVTAHDHACTLYFAYFRKELAQLFLAGLPGNALDHDLHSMHRDERRHMREMVSTTRCC